MDEIIHCPCSIGSNAIFSDFKKAQHSRISEICKPRIMLFVYQMYFWWSHHNRNVLRLRFYDSLGVVLRLMIGEKIEIFVKPLANFCNPISDPHKSSLSLPAAQSSKISRFDKKILSDPQIYVKKLFFYFWNPIIFELDWSFVRVVPIPISIPEMTYEKKAKMFDSNLSKKWYRFKVFHMSRVVTFAFVGKIWPKRKFNSASVLAPDGMSCKSLQYELFSSKAISESL